MSELNTLMAEIGTLSKAVSELSARPTVDPAKIEKMVEELIAKRSQFDRTGSFVKWGTHEGDDKDLPSLITKRSSDAKVLELQDVNDACLILSKVHDRDPRSFRLFQKYQGLASDLRKAMDTADSSGGGSWIPTGFSAQ